MWDTFRHTKNLGNKRSHDTIKSSSSIDKWFFASHLNNSLWVKIKGGGATTNTLSNKPPRKIIRLNVSKLTNFGLNVTYGL